MTKLLTEPSLLQALVAAAKMPMDAEALRQQRIDYIVGALSDEGTSVTRAQVVQELGKFVGVAA